MGLFGSNKSFEAPVVGDDVFIKRAESEIDILASELKNKNWTEIWNSLCHSELNSSSITEKMSLEAKDKFKNVIVELKEVFNSEKENVDKDIVDSIQTALDKISEKL